MLVKLLGRTLGTAGAWLAVAALTFALTYVIPADPARTLAGAQADAETVSRLRAQLGLDDPLLLRFGRYVWDALHGDFGTSFVTGQQVLPAVLDRLPATAALAAGALVVYLAVGAALGAAGAVRPGSALDRAGAAFSVLGAAVPSFWIGMLLLWALAFAVPVFPLGGAGTLAHLVLPALTLGLGGAAYYARTVRLELGRELGSEYVRAARARGLSEGRILFRHALPNASLPLVTLLGLDAAALLGGAVLTESVFGWPGIGQQAVAAIGTLDVPMIMGTVLFSATAILLVNWLTDLAYLALDPRLRG